MPHSMTFGRTGNMFANRTTNLPSTSLCSATMWIRPTSVGATDKIFMSLGAVTAGAFNDYELMVSTASLALWNGSAQANGSTLVVNIWRYIALTLNGTSGTNALVYLDGALNISGTARAVGSGDLRIGNNSGSEPHVGDIAAINVWNRVLSIDEIVAQMPYAWPLNPAGLNCSYPMMTPWDMANYDVDALAKRSTAASRWIDVSGNAGNDFTETGTIDYGVGPPIQFAPSQYLRRSRRFVAAAGPPPSRRRIHLVT